MDIDYSRELKELFNAWHDCFLTKNPLSKNYIYVFGDDRDGIKTVVQQFLHLRKKKTRYFSFACLDNAHALRAFAKAFELETESPETWEEAGRAFQKKYCSQVLLVFFDDLEFFSEQDVFRKACFEFIAKKNIVVAETSRCRREDWKPEPISHFSLFIGCRTLSDLCKLFPDYAKPDIVRLYSMTGGISTILNELNADRSFEDNLRTLLHFDSAFTKYLPEWLRAYFRTPESYYPILCSMAKGKRRLSEIAHDVGFPNNKCLNYLQALMRAGLARTEAAIGNRQTAYLLTSSYIAAWCLYMYERRSKMISDPEAFLQEVMSSVDQQLALQAFRNACFRYLEHGTKEYLNPFAGQIFSSTNPEVYRDVIIDLGDGSSVVLDYCTQKDDHSLVAVIPDDLNRRFTKDDIENIRYAVKRLDMAIEKLGVEFSALDLTFHAMAGGKAGDVTSYWPGAESEDVLVCVFKGTQIEEPFHRQDFFFINYAYRNSYQALSAKYNNTVTIHEDACYIGQPYSGYALRCDSMEETVIIGVLIRKDAFFREYLSLVYADAELFRFFIEPQTNRFSDEFIHLTMTKDHAIRVLLELMVIEYADRREDTQQVLKALLQALLLQIARRYRVARTADEPPVSLAAQLVQYIGDHSDTVTLGELSEHFSYHPNYISALLPRETGKNFSELLLEKRMERATLLLRNTSLSIEEIAAMLGYSNHSNFYKAFRKYYHASPREYSR